MERLPHMSPNFPELVDLNRQFVAVGENPWYSSAAEESYSGLKWWMHAATWTWDDLITRSRVVVLGEAGSGKTSEFQQQVSKLTAKGVPALFVRLEEMISQPLQWQFSHKETERFQQWNASMEEAFFFLDSVDEAKITRPADFHMALRRLKASLPPDFRPRTRIFLSCRASEWHPSTDGAVFAECFGEGPPAGGAQHGEESLITTAHLAPLEWLQIDKLLNARGISDQGELYSELCKPDLDELIRRPLDLLAIVDMWEQDHRLGSLTDVIEADISRKLVETPTRNADRLSPRGARAGAETLAAATILCGQLTFKTGDEAVGSALDPRPYLPATWDEDQCRALMRRPIFDSASRGTVRFHHRRVREYLAASWIKARMDSGCQVAELDSMVFGLVNGRRVIRRSLAPVVPWLTAGNQSWTTHLREWILETAPSIHFQFGDAGSLPLEYKCRIIRAVSDPNNEQRTLWFDADDGTLSRFADSRLDEEISRVIRCQSAPQRVRLVMLKMAQLARLKQSSQAALDLIKSGQHRAAITAAAVRAVGASPCPEHLHSLHELALRLPSQPEQVTKAFLEILGAERLQFDEGWSILLKTFPVPGFSERDFSHLDGFLRHGLPVQWRGPLLRLLLKNTGLFGLEESATNQIPQATCAWLVSLIPKVVLALVTADKLSDEEMMDIAAAVRPGRKGRFSSTDRTEIEKGTCKHPSLRQLLFWDYVIAESKHESEAVDRIKQMLPPAFTSSPDYGEVFDQASAIIQMIGRPTEHAPVLNLNELDLIWLEQDASRRGENSTETANGRRFAALVARDLREAVKARTAAEVARRNTKRRQQKTVVRRCRRESGFRISSWRSAPVDIWQWVAAQRERLEAILHFYALTQNGRLSRAIRHSAPSLILGSFSERIRRRLEQVLWEDIAMELGPARSFIARRWRRLLATTLCEKEARTLTDPAMVVAAVGIEDEFQREDFSMASLSLEDIRLITACALRTPFWTFPQWFQTLVSKLSDRVDSVLAETICREKAWSDVARTVAERLCKIELGPETQAAILRKLSEPACCDEDSVRMGIRVLLSQRNAQVKSLAHLARSVSEDLTCAIKLRALWISVWLRTDVMPALDFLERNHTGAPPAQVLVLACANLSCDINRFAESPPPAWQPTEVDRLLRFVHNHIPATLERSPEISELDLKAASELEDRLFSLLKEDCTEAATNSLGTLANDSSFKASRGYIVELWNQQISRSLDVRAWRPRDIREFEQTHETDPRNDLDLFRIGVSRLRDIKLDVENSDTGLRMHIRAGDDERQFRIWLAHELTRRSNRRYVVPQEAVIDQEQRPDLRLENPEAGAISMEIKVADDRSLTDLLNGLEKQLVGQYLRAHHSRCGIYVVALLSDRCWRSMSGEPITFQQLADHLSARAAQMTGEMVTSNKRVAVVTMDFRAKVRPPTALKR